MQKNDSLNREFCAEQKRRKREKKLIFFISLGFAFLTILEVSLSELSEKLSVTASLFFFIVVNINIILLGLLIFLVFRNFIKLLLERKDRVFGSKLKSKLIVVFLGFALIPTILLFTISAFYIHNSFGKWFNSHIQTSLKSGAEISETYYENLKKLGRDFGETVSHFIAREKLFRDSKKDFLKKTLKDFLENYHLASLELYQKDSGQYSEFVHPKYTDYGFPRPPEVFLSNALEGYENQFIQSIGKGNLVRCIFPIYQDTKQEKPSGALVLSFFVPLSLVLKIEKIQNTYQDYAATSPFASSIQSSYFLLLILITLLIMFTATWFGFYLARQLIIPLESLAEATKEIVKGNLDIQLDQVGSKMATDEFNILATSFNKMTQDLRKNRGEIDKAHKTLKTANRELYQRHKYVEAILENVAAGIISLDAFGIVTTMNKSAQNIFNVDTKNMIGKHYRDIVGDEYIKQVDEFICDIIENEKINFHKKEFSFTRGGKEFSLLASVATVRDENGDYIGMVVVLEDLTEMIDIQKAAAWRDVAKRIAHEIKNPLTPIKLSAQRLKKKLTQQEDADLIHMCIDTIIHEVDGLKDLVNEFSDFARLPRPRFSKISLKEIVVEVVSLYQSAHEKIKFIFKEMETTPLVYADREQIRRVFINLVENALDAVGKQGEISFYLKYNSILDIVIIEVCDNGKGFDDALKSKIFEPYFTTKTKGSGLGLAIVQRILKEHGGIIRVYKNDPQGSKFIIELPVQNKTYFLAQDKTSNTGYFTET
ncbi:MAG: PAS domain S-box protein [Deltaproteobacteria bacterium]|nr:PAS domain S-box protein [Deltaproteobacteria bacterium]